MKAVQANKQQMSDRLVEAMGRLIVMMQEVDDTCLRLTEDISKKDLMIIAFVGQSGKVMMREIAEYMKIPDSTTTSLVDRLVQKGFLERDFSEADRRSIHIVLGELGKNCHDLMCDMKNEMANRILQDLEENEARHFIGLLEKVTGNLHKYVPVR